MADVQLRNLRQGTDRARGFIIQPVSGVAFYAQLRSANGRTAQALKFMRGLLGLALGNKIAP